VGRSGRSHLTRTRRGSHRTELPPTRRLAMTDATLRAWAYLSRVIEPPCAELGALVRRVGPVEAAERVRRGQVDDVVARRTEARRESGRSAADSELLDRRGGCLITPDGAEWPTLAFAAFGGAAGEKPQGRPTFTL